MIDILSVIVKRINFHHGDPSDQMFIGEAIQLGLLHAPLITGKTRCS